MGQNNPRHGKSRWWKRRTPRPLEMLMDDILHNTGRTFTSKIIRPVKQKGVEEVGGDNAQLGWS